MTLGITMLCKSIKCHHYGEHSVIRENVAEPDLAKNVLETTLILIDNLKLLLY